MPGAEGGEVVQYALLSLPSRNSSNKCTFHTKVSLLVLLLSLDPPLVDCKLKSLCDSPKPFYCKCPAVKMASNWVPVCSVCGGSPCAFTYCQTCKHLFWSLWLSWGLRFFRKRDSVCTSVNELLTQWFYIHSPHREFAHSCELRVVSASLRLLKGGFISHLLDTRIQEKLVLGKRLTVRLANLKY